MVQSRIGLLGTTGHHDQAAPPPYPYSKLPDAQRPLICCTPECWSDDGIPPLTKAGVY